MEGASMSAEANVGVVGLAAMGGSLARNLAHHGNKVAVFNRSYGRTEKLMNEHGNEGEFFPAKTLEEFVDSLVKPRTAIIMVKAGAPTDATIAQLEEVFEPGDIIVDAGNAYFPDTIRREKEISARGLHFVGCGVSGGEEEAPSPVLRGKTHRKKNSLQEYPEHLFGNNVVKERRQTYVSSENYERVRTLLSVIAPTVSISCYIDNILSAHLEQYRDELNAIYSSRINLKPL